jgi:hypothetical protein
MEAYQPNRVCSCTRCRARGIIGPTLLVVLGVLLLLDNLGVPGAGFGHTWPLLLIAIGVVKVLQVNASIYGHVPPSPPVVPPTAPPMTSVPGSAGEVGHV